MIAAVETVDEEQMHKETVSIVSGLAAIAFLVLLLHSMDDLGRVLLSRRNPNLEENLPASSSSCSNPRRISCARHGSTTAPA